ncbi:MAG: YebC/PmpR family DNA-binding transcriptional regulator [Methylococcus sp.]|jgi:YebC/PmpR family DNA-binding regulatory protein|nr:MAG: YebC/PmpR family DNA-binding transcriptional regulator [Methylococcus sp.]
MAGHSKWANIQHRKGAQDARRGKLFTKLIREITVSARTGGGDVAHNPRLRTAMDKALMANMSKDTIERAIKKGIGSGDGEHFDEIRYEGYGSGGIAVMVDCLTDNRLRTVAEVRHAFSKAGGNLGTDGSVAYLFTKMGVLSYPGGVDEDALMEAALEAGADDVISHEDHSVEVLVDPDYFEGLRDGLALKGLVPENAEVTMRASTTIALDEEDAGKMIRLLERLEDLDDVQNVYSNADISEDILAKLA